MKVGVGSMSFHFAPLIFEGKLGHLSVKSLHIFIRLCSHSGLNPTFPLLR